jgi:hypothetical protein
MIGCFPNPYPETVADESDDCEQGASIPVRFPNGFLLRATQET